MYNVGNIAKGAISDVFNLNDEISQKRLKICKICPIYSNNFGGQCNGKLWLNPENGEVSLYPQEGFYKGCSCKLSWKTRVADEECPAGKW